MKSKHKKQILVALLMSGISLSISAKNREINIPLINPKHVVFKKDFEKFKADNERNIRRGLAEQAALNGLFQPYRIEKLNLTAAVGGYKSQTALAVGTGYRFNEKFAAKAGIAFDAHREDVSYNAGVNFEWK